MLQPSAQRARAVASSSAVLPEPGEPIRLIASTPWRGEVLAVVRRRAGRCRRACSRCTSTGTSSGSPQPQSSHITAPPSRSARARSRRPRRAAPARRRRRSAGRSPRGDLAAAAPGNPSAPARARCRARRRRRSCARGTSRRRVAAAPARRRRARRCASDTRWTRVAPRAAPLRPRRASTSAWTIEYSCMLRPRSKNAAAASRRSLEPSANRAVGDARQVLELLVEVEVEPVDAGGLVHQGLARCPAPPWDRPASCWRDRQHLGVEAPRREDRGDEAELERPLRVEARVRAAPAPWRAAGRPAAAGRRSSSRRR